MSLVTSNNSLSLTNQSTSINNTAGPAKKTYDSKVIFEDFIPWGSWTVDKDGEKWKDDPTMPKYIIDNRTKKRYWNQPEDVLRIKNCFTLVLAPVGHLISLPLNVVYRAIKLATFSNFWPDDKPYNFKACLKEAKKDILRIALTPIAFVGMALISIYGIFGDARNASKVYAAIESSIYGEDGWKWAPCFSPDPERHFFDGDPNSSRAF